MDTEETEFFSSEKIGLYAQVKYLFGLPALLAFFPGALLWKGVFAAFWEFYLAMFIVVWVSYVLGAAVGAFRLRYWL